MSAIKHWFEIAPADAVGITLPAEGIIGPINEEGRPCPWPWEPQQMVGVPMGQYHCGYCGVMAVAGLPHPDYAEELKAEAQRAEAGVNLDDDLDNETSYGAYAALAASQDDED